MPLAIIRAQSMIDTSSPARLILREGTTCSAVRACSLRLANVYGYGGASMNANRGILNIMMKRAIDGEPLTLYGDGAHLRDFVHIEDVVEAFSRAIATAEVCDGGHYVIASGRGHTLAEAYAMIAEVAMERLGRRIEIVRVPEPADLHPIEKRNFIGDSHVFRYANRMAAACSTCAPVSLTILCAARSW